MKSAGMVLAFLVGWYLMGFWRYKKNGFRDRGRR